MSVPRELLQLLFAARIGEYEPRVRHARGSFRACRPSTLNRECQLACCSPLAFRYHHLPARVALLTELRSASFPSKSKLAAILLRLSLEVAGVLAQPVAILLETAVGDQRTM